MARLIQILFVCSFIMLPAGCDNARKSADTKGIKIGELAPIGKRVQPQILRTTNVEIVSYELSVDNIASMEGIWQILNPGTLRYNDLDGFAANGLRAAMGNFAAFNKVAEILKTVNAKKLPTNSLLISNNQPELVSITRMPQHKTISFISRQGVIKNADVGPGIVGLQILSRQIAGDSALPGANNPPESNIGAQANRRQLASIQVTPVIFSSTEGVAPALAQQIRENDLRIYSAGFSAIMKPGDFILLSPREYNPDETTASGRFFTKSGSGPAITIYLLVCTSIS